MDTDDPDTPRAASDEPSRAEDDPFTGSHLTPAQRQEILARARRELPRRDRQFAEAMENLRRIANGQRPLRH